MYILFTLLQVFFLVVIFGLFHGLLYFPTLLSLLGPRAYSTAIKEDSERAGSANSVGDEKEANGNIAMKAHVEANPYTGEKTDNNIQSNGAVHNGESLIDLNYTLIKGRGIHGRKLLRHSHLWPKLAKIYSAKCPKM